MNLYRKISFNYKFYVTLSLTILGLLTTLVSVGFAALNQNLNVSGDIDYEKDSNLLYDVIENEASIGTYARKYTNNHRDSFTENPTKDIYYWYASNDTSADVILDEWNVIFGGFCWQMIRTTDTGGVKLMYNGTPNDGKCDNSGLIQAIGTSKYNINNNSPADVGYMYNKRYITTNNSQHYEEMYEQSNFDSSYNYYFADSFSYSGGKYRLVDPYLRTGSLSSVIGKYTFCRYTSNTTSSYIEYVIDFYGGLLYTVILYGGNDITDITYTYGDSYVDNGNGTYTINNPTTINIAEYYSNASNILKKYVCVNATNNTCNNVRYVTKSNANMYYIDITENIKYASGFTYDETSGKYTLSNNSVTFGDLGNSTNQNSLKTHHYTCFDENGICEKISYIYYISDDLVFHYINLENGKDIYDAKNEMLSNDDVNTIDSSVKTMIDDWYRDNMISYTSYLEDIIFCNNRYQSNNSNDGWNPNGGSIKSNMTFDSNSLICSNDTDKFSVLNNKAKLTYPVGLLNYEESRIMGVNGSAKIRNIGYNYHLISPEAFYNSQAYQWYAAFGGYNAASSVDGNKAVRPVVSLKPGTEYVSGDGSKDDPYIVDTDESN